MLVGSSCSSTSSKKLTDLLAGYSALLLLLASIMRAASLILPKTVTGVPLLPCNWLWVIDSDVDRPTRIVVPLLSVVGVAMSYRPLATHSSSQGISFVLRDSGIGSGSMGSTIPVEEAGASS